nr:sigma-70 family RNA polymerase sigma factor [Actinomycetota bacterium]
MIEFPPVEHRAATAPASSVDDERAFEAMYRQWRLPLIRLCRRYVGPQGDAEALAHEAFLKAWLSWDRYAKERPFWPWVATIARRLCINEHHARSRREALLPRASAMLTDPVHDESDYESRLDDVAVHEALHHLSRRHRRMLLLREHEGWSCEDIAGLEGVTVETVRSVLKRARAAFRHCFEQFSSTTLAGVPAFLRVVAGRLRQASDNWASAVVARVGAWEGATVVAAVLALLHGAAAPATVEP